MFESRSVPMLMSSIAATAARQFHRNARASTSRRCAFTSRRCAFVGASMHKALYVALHPQRLRRIYTAQTRCFGHTPTFWDSRRREKSYDTGTPTGIPLSLSPHASGYDLLTPSQIEELDAELKSTYETLCKAAKQLSLRSVARAASRIKKATDGSGGPPAADLRRALYLSTYRALLHCCGAQGKVAEAREVLGDMLRFGIAPDVHSRTLALKAAVVADDSDAVADFIPKKRQEDLGADIMPLLDAEDVKEWSAETLECILLHCSRTTNVEYATLLVRTALSCGAKVSDTAKDLALQCAVRAREPALAADILDAFENTEQAVPPRMWMRLLRGAAENNHVRRKLETL